MDESTRTGEPRAAAVALSAEAALALATHALQRIGFARAEADIIAANLVDCELCGYPALGMARLITIAEDPRTREPRKPVAIVHETPVSALVDGGNYVGTYALYRATEIALAKARAQRFALVGVHNSYLSGRNAYYLEMIARAGFVGIHFASSQPFVVPLGGRVPMLGTNPLAFGVPADPDPLIFDMGTSAITHGEVVLAARLAQPLPEGVAIDAEGRATTDAVATEAGGILPFAGHKGYGLSLIVQALGVLAGAALPQVPVEGFGFLFVVFDPGLLLPPEEFKGQVAELLDRVKNTPRQPGVDSIRIPSERAYRERARGRREGIVLERVLYDRIQNL